MLVASFAAVTVPGSKYAGVHWGRGRGHRRCCLLQTRSLRSWKPSGAPTSSRWCSWNPDDTSSQGCCGGYSSGVVMRRRRRRTGECPWCWSSPEGGFRRGGALLRGTTPRGAGKGDPLACSPCLWFQCHGDGGRLGFVRSRNVRRFLY